MGPNLPAVSSDASSFLESGQCSNEDGYDGDSSDIENESDWQNDIEIQQPLLPGFWLILQVLQHSIKVFLHTRDTDDHSNHFHNGKNVMKQVIKNVKNICKIVNQSLLLQDLHENRMCNQLLEPEGSEDIWRKDDQFLMQIKSHISDEQGDDDDRNDYQDRFLKANLDFMPGAFSCNIVWQTHFILHPRLKMGPGRSGVSRGIQALRTVLNAFSVNNRENMFVYSESSGSVFYLRLNESQCSSPANAVTDDLTPGSRSSSMVTLPIKKVAVENEDEIIEIRPRVNSASDRDHSFECASVTSRSSLNRLRMEDSIQLLVHGIGEAGSEIKEELVEVLQNRLDEAVLDVISVTLLRNPMCKLTKEDVLFLQKPEEAPKTVIHFTVTVHALPYIQALAIYLRQNLNHFLTLPKYIDNKPDHHFQDYTLPLEASHSKESDIFLYNRPQGSGNKGIALIAFSLVDGLGNPVQYMHFPKLPCTLRDVIPPFEFESLTSTKVYDPSVLSARHPGPMALIRFSIWERGKLDMEQLTKMLKNTVRHALWDVVTEYKLLSVPLAMTSFGDDACIYSEPATPIKVRSAAWAPDALRKSHSSSPSSLVHAKFRELSASVPDLIVKSHSPITSPKDVASATSWKMLMSSVPGTPHPNTKNLKDTSSPVFSAETPKQEINEQSDQQLHEVYSCTMKEWLEFAGVLGVPSVSKRKFVLNHRHSVMNVIKDLLFIIKKQGLDMSMKIFRQSRNKDDSEIYLLQHSCEINSQDDSNSLHKEMKLPPSYSDEYIIIGRDSKLWKATVSCLEENFSDIPSNCSRLNLKYAPTYQLLNYSENGEMLPSISSTSAHLHQFIHANGTGLKQSNASLTHDNNEVLFIPRQNFLFITLNDKEMNVYTYNWAHEPWNVFYQQTISLVQWTNSRSRVLTSLLMQKMGLFCNQPINRKTSEARSKELSSSKTSSFNELELLKFSYSSMRELSAPGHASSRRNISVTSNLPLFSEILRDIVLPYPIQNTASRLMDDLFLKHSYQLQDAFQVDNKDQRRKLILALQGSSAAQSNCSSILMDDHLRLIDRISRVEHYCLTPLLFLPQWRWQVAAARDYTLPCSSSFIESFMRKTSESHLAGLKGLDAKGRRQSINLPILQSHNSPKILSPRLSNDDVWHAPLCLAYVQEFVQYIQNLGFVPLQTKTGNVKQNHLSIKDAELDLITNTSRSGVKNSVQYVIKTLLGGSIIILQLKIVEPYFSVQMYCIEGSRLVSVPSRTCNSQFTIAFLDECDKMKVQLHLHSFTYDYHLRSIHSYVSGRQLIFRQGYHLTSFLDDFVKYYQKSPNFSWNLVYHDVLSFEDLSIPSDQLYNHLLDHDKLYGMQVLRMVPVVQFNDKEPRNEYVLVQLSSQKVSYKDGNEIRHTDDFDISLLISQESPQDFTYDKHESNVFNLSYYIILTSRRELYPRTAIEKKLGKFRTITTATPIPSRKVSLVSMDRPDPDKLEIPTLAHKTSVCSSDKSQEFETGSQSESWKEVLSLETNFAGLSSIPSVHLNLAQQSGSDSENLASSLNVENMNRGHLGIKQESVNYLGYFSTTEELMHQIMEEQAHAAKEHIHKILAKATIHWRRDSLWKRLLCPVKSSGQDGKKKKDDTSDLQSLDFTEFTTLLSLVSSQSLSAFDQRLLQFSNMHLSWYEGLVKLLINKYPEQSRRFIDPSESTQHVIILNSHYNDHFMLLTVEKQMNRAKLCSVFRKNPLSPDTQHVTERKSMTEQSIHQVIEDFINTCCFHLWSCIL